MRAQFCRTVRVIIEEWFSYNESDFIMKMSLALSHSFPIPLTLLPSATEWWSARTLGRHQYLLFEAPSLQCCEQNRCLLLVNYPALGIPLHLQEAAQGTRWWDQCHQLVGGCLRNQTQDLLNDLPLIAPWGKPKSWQFSSREGLDSPRLLEKISD